MSKVRITVRFSTFVFKGTHNELKKVKRRLLNDTRLLLENPSQDDDLQILEIASDLNQVESLRRKFGRISEGNVSHINYAPVFQNAWLNQVY